MQNVHDLRRITHLQIVFRSLDDTQVIIVLPSK